MNRLSASRISFQVETKLGPGRHAGGISAAARDLGIAKPDAHRAVKVAGLSNEAKQAAREEGLDDNRTALLNAAKQTSPADQVKAIRARAQKVVPIAKAPLTNEEAQEKQFTTLVSPQSNVGTKC